MEFEGTFVEAFNRMEKSALRNLNESPSGKISRAKQPPVTQQVCDTVERQKQMIEHLIQKKRDQQNKWKRISSANLQYRQKLRNKIQQEQIKHKKKRQQFLQKRIKAQRYKSSEVIRKKSQLQEKRKQKRLQNQKEFKNLKSQTIQFWQSKAVKTAQNFYNQTAVAPLYQDAIQRKKISEYNNIKFSEKTKQQLLARHSKCFDSKKDIFVGSKTHDWQNHASQCVQNYEKNCEYLDSKNKKFINKICYSQQKSSNLVKKQKKQYQKKLKGRLIDQHQNFQTKRSNFREYHMNRAKSMKQCRCHDKGSVPKLQNQQQYRQQQMNSRSPFKKTGLPLFTRTNFAKRSKLHQDIVLQNKMRIKQAQDYKDEKRLMIERQISEAVWNRKNILNLSNSLVRTARVNG